jgi:hypothetical protein
VTTERFPRCGNLWKLDRRILLLENEAAPAQRPVVAMDAPAAIAHQVTARGHRDDFAEGIDPILQRHGATLHWPAEQAMRLDQAIAELDIVRDFIPVTNSNRPRTRLRPAHITIHNTDNPKPGADAAAHARYMKGEDAQARQVSWHFTVDDRAIIQSLPESEIGWHAGPGNASSLGIEICMHEGMDEALAYQRAARLVAALARKHGISVPDGIKQHHDWTGKNCPSVLRATPDGWSGFLRMVQAADSQIEAPKRAGPRKRATVKRATVKKRQRRAQAGGRPIKSGP